MQEENKFFFITMINKTNKNYPVGEKQTGRLDKARQGKARQGKARQGRAGQGLTGQDTRHRRHNIWQRTHTELQNYKGSK